MPRYIYNGPSRKYDSIKSPTKTLLPEASLVIINSRPFKGKKSEPSPLLKEYKGSKLLEYYTDISMRLAENCDVITVCGHDTVKVVKSTKTKNIRFAENIRYSYSNDMEDLRIGINLCRQSPCFVVDANLLPTMTSFRELLDQDESAALTTIDPSYGFIGIIKSEKDLIKDFKYSSEEKLLGMYKIKPSDLNKLKMKVNGSMYKPKRFLYEILGGFNIKAVETESKFIRIDRC